MYSVLGTNLCVSVVTSTLWIWDVAGFLVFVLQMKELRSEWLRNWWEGYNRLCWELNELSILPFLVVFLVFWHIQAHSHQCPSPATVLSERKPNEYKSYIRDNSLRPSLQQFKNTMHEVGTAHTQVCAMFQSYNVWTEACELQYSTWGDGPYSTIERLDKPASEDTHIQRD